MSEGYAMVWINPAQHIAAELEGAAPAALSAAELAASYSPLRDADITRAMIHGQVSTEKEAHRFIIDETLKRLHMRGKNEQLVEEDGCWRFADGYSYDNLWLNGSKLYRPERDVNARLGDPFSPLSGVFSDDVRSAVSKARDDYSELRESMKENGWIDDPAFAAVKDERGVVLMGHRRLKVAAELGIEPIIRVVVCGEGDEADIKRLQLAVLSNIGHKSMSPGDRQNIVKVLAGPEHDWTQMSIAAALGVSRQTIQLDIAQLKDSGNLPTVGKKNRSEKRGRPAGSTKPKDNMKSRNPALLAEIERRITTGQPVSQDDMKEQFDCSAGTINSAQSFVEGRLAAKEQHVPQTAQPEPVGHKCEFVSVMMCPGCGRVHD